MSAPKQAGTGAAGPLGRGFGRRPAPRVAAAARPGAATAIGALRRRNGQPSPGRKATSRNRLATRSSRLAPRREQALGGGAARQSTRLGRPKPGSRGGERERLGAGSRCRRRVSPGPRPGYFPCRASPPLQRDTGGAPARTRSRGMARPIAADLLNSSARLRRLQGRRASVAGAMAGSAAPMRAYGGPGPRAPPRAVPSRPGARAFGAASAAERSALELMLASSPLAAAVGAARSAPAAPVPG